MYLRPHKYGVSLTLDPVEYQKRYYQANKEKRNLQSFRWKDAHREEIKAYNKKYKSEHREELTLKKREYRKKQEVMNAQG